MMVGGHCCILLFVISWWIVSWMKEYVSLKWLGFFSTWFKIVEWIRRRAFCLWWLFCIMQNFLFEIHIVFSNYYFFLYLSFYIFIFSYCMGTNYQFKIKQPWWWRRQQQHNIKHTIFQNMPHIARTHSTKTEETPSSPLSPHPSPKAQKTTSTLRNPKFSTVANFVPSPSSLALEKKNHFMLKKSHLSS